MTQSNSRMLITVVNTRAHFKTKNDFYIGRGSVLGNPYTHLDSKFDNVIKVESRDKACDAYEVMLDAKMKDKTSDEYKTMCKLLSHVRKGNPLNLVCFCKPHRCHGDYIKTLLVDALEKGRS